MLLIGGPEDAHAAAVARGLAARGVAARHLDFADFPGAAQLTWDPLARRGHIDINPTASADLTHLTASSLDLARLRAVYWRTAARTRAAARLRADLHPFAEDETRRALESMLRALACPVINTPDAVAAHRFKPLQSAEVAALGVATPATLITSSPPAVRQFFADHPRGIIVKPVGGGAYARRIGLAELERATSIAACPMQYQAFIPGDDIRVYIVGDRIFAAQIVTGDPDHVDFRTVPGHHSVALTLDLDSALRCRQIARTLGLTFTGIDLRRTPAGQLVFLEANPSPMFLRFEADTGHPIKEALIDLLLAPPAAHSPT